uniref:Uncharacterized protein n=1 Tax=Peronospora matthiolae TaxID=2874970 RepID=A0AAV1V7C8_9STRA
MMKDTELDLDLLAINEDDVRQTVYKQLASARVKQDPACHSARPRTGLGQQVRRNTTQPSPETTIKCSRNDV